MAIEFTDLTTKETDTAAQPIAAPVPLPLDDQLLKQVGGGFGPAGGW